MTDDLRSYHAAARDLGIGHRHRTGRWRNNRAENSHQPTRRRDRTRKVSGASVQHKDFSPFTQQPTTRSTFNAISFQQGRTELFEPRPWTHGVRPLLQHEHDHRRDHSRPSFDNVTKPFRPLGRRNRGERLRILCCAKKAWPPRLKKVLICGISSNCSAAGCSRDAPMSRKTLLMIFAAVLAVGGYFGYQYWRGKQNALPPGIASGNGRLEAKLVDIAPKEPLRVKEIRSSRRAIWFTRAIFASSWTRIRFRLSSRKPS